MRIVIIVFVGILSYLVVLPGYYFVIPESTEKILNFGTLKKLPVVDATKSSSKLTVSNPGNEPSLK